MTYWNGFAIGIAVGTLLVFVATGHIVTVEYTELFRSACFLMLFIIFVLGLWVTLYRASHRDSCFTPTRDGFIAGIGFIEAILLFLMYGFRI